jgi:acyl-CoA reductase-like NAD-dependent aldehyde dehydrogenase
MGPLSSQTAADILQEQYQDAIDKGATVLVAGGRVDGPGAFFQPAMITDITPDMRVYSEEAFGPLAMVYRVPDADAAVDLANSSQYGLGGTVFGEDVAEAKRVASRLDTGHVGDQHLARRSHRDAVRRDQALGRRPGARPLGHGPVRQHQDLRHRLSNGNQPPLAMPGRLMR